MTYKEKLLDPRWQKKRLEILERDKFTCLLCGDTKTNLHVHHEKYVGNPWDAPNECLKTYCKHCHSLHEYFKNSDVVLFDVVKNKISSSDTQLWCLFNRSDNEFKVYLMEYQDHMEDVKFISCIDLSIFLKISNLFSDTNKEYQKLLNNGENTHS